jgi:hypothetical protein
MSGLIESMCSTKAVYLVGLIMYVMSAFMAFNHRMEFAGICVFFILYAGSLGAAVRRWFNRVAEPLPAPWSFAGTLAAMALGSVAAAITISVFTGRISKASGDTHKLEFGNQTTRKNSLKKVIVAAFAFSWTAFVLSATKWPVALATAFVNASANETREVAGKEVAGYAAMGAAAIAVALAFTAMIQASTMSAHFAR